MEEKGPDYTEWKRSQRICICSVSNKVEKKHLLRFLTVQELVSSGHGLKTDQKISTLHTLPKVPNYTLPRTCRSLNGEYPPLNVVSTDLNTTSIAEMLKTLIATIQITLYAHCHAMFSRSRYPSLSVHHFTKVLTDSVLHKTSIDSLQLGFSRKITEPCT